MRQQPDSDVLDSFRKELDELIQWGNFADSAFGKFFVSFIDKAIEETIADEDKFNIYDKTEHHILYHLASVRSKRQTLKSVKEKIVGAKQKAKEIGEELGKYK